MHRRYLLDSPALASFERTDHRLPKPLENPVEQIPVPSGTNRSEDGAGRGTGRKSRRSILKGHS